MTKRTVTKKRKGTKRAAERPVDAEIKRAAERAGVRRRPPPPVNKYDEILSAAAALRDGGRAEFVDEYVARMRNSYAQENAAFLLRAEGRRLQEVADRIQPAPATNDSLRQNHKAFDGGEGIDKDATVGDLLRLLFEAPNRGDNALLSDFLLCQADDAALLACCAANDDGMLSEPMQRVAFRMEWRAKIVLELDRRMRAAEEAAGGAS